MDAIYIQIFMVVFSTLISGLVSFLFYQIKKHEQLREEQERKLQQERLQADEDLKTELECLKAGSVALLHNRLVSIITQCEMEGCKHLYQIENVSAMYRAYHGLGGNGTVTHLYDMFMKLPIAASESKNND